MVILGLCNIELQLTERFRRNNEIFALKFKKFIPNSGVGVVFLTNKLATLKKFKAAPKFFQRVGVETSGRAPKKLFQIFGAH